MNTAELNVEDLYIGLYGVICVAHVANVEARDDIKVSGLRPMQDAGSSRRVYPALLPTHPLAPDPGNRNTCRHGFDQG
jgi:hypothetical protein